jgi:hypothetical protein
MAHDFMFHWLHWLLHHPEQGGDRALFAMSRLEACYGLQLVPLPLMIIKRCWLSPVAHHHWTIFEETLGTVYGLYGVWCMVCEVLLLLTVPYGDRPE